MFDCLRKIKYQDIIVKIKEFDFRDRISRIKEINYKDIISKIKTFNYKSVIFRIKRQVANYKNIICVALAMTILTIILSVILVNIKNSSMRKEERVYDGVTFVTETYPIFKDVVFVGDSYSHEIAYQLGFDTIIYSSPGLTVSELKYCFESAKKNQKKFVVVFIGPNDFRFSIDTNIFYNELKKDVEMFTKDSKVVLCEYMSSKYTEELEEQKKVKYKVTDYDAEIKRIASELDRVYYFDMNDITGKVEYYKYNDDKQDKLHFNHKFYVEYINRLYNFIESIR